MHLFTGILEPPESHIIYVRNSTHMDPIKFTACTNNPSIEFEVLIQAGSRPVDNWRLEKPVYVDEQGFTVIYYKRHAPNEDICWVAELTVDTSRFMNTTTFTGKLHYKSSPTSQVPTRKPLGEVIIIKVEDDSE